MSHDYQPGDHVTVLSGAQQVAGSGLGATIVRKMLDADDYEVEYDEEQPGVSPFVHPDRLLLVAAAPAEPSA